MERNEKNVIAAVREASSIQQLFVLSFYLDCAQVTDLQLLCSLHLIKWKSFHIG